MEVVVVHERDAPVERVVQRPPVDALEVVLADVVGRVRLAGEDDLDRPPIGRQDRGRGDRGREKISSGRL